MKILITGGAGFIGSHIQDALIELGHEVAIVDSLRSGKTENVHPKAKFWQVDIRDNQKLPEVFAEFKPEIVYHLAAQNEVPHSMSHPQEDIDINILGGFNLLECCKANNVKKLIYSNTGGAYYGEVPDSSLPITEDEPIKKPSSFYGVSKATFEQYLKLYSTVFGLSYVSLRYANVYGPRQAGNKEAGIIAIFTTKMLEGVTPTIFGDGGHTRDYVYVGDVVAANIKALTYTQNDYFNICTSVETSNNQVYEALEAVLQTGKPAKYGPDRPGDVRRNVLSNTKAKKLLNWSPEVSLKDGVQKTVEFYKNPR